MIDNYQFLDDGVLSPKGGKMPFKTKPFKHQLKCLKEYGERKYFALLADMGTGKTWIIINDFAYLFCRGLVRDLLVIAPNGVQWNWVKNELATHLPEPVQNKVIYAGYSGAMNKKEKDNLQGLFSIKARGLGRILCVNWESLSNAKGTELINNFLTEPARTMIVLDESDYCKNPTSKRAKFVQSLADKAAYKRIMTGTPINNSPFDAWMQFNFLDPSILKAPSFIGFKCRYGVFLSQENPLVRAIRAKTRARRAMVQAVEHGHPVYKNLDELKNLIAPHSFRVLKSDCLDLPPKVYKNIYVDMTAKQAQAYKKMCREGILLLENKELTVLNKISILTKLCQIAGNNCILPDGTCEKVDSDHNPKLEKCIELIKQAINLDKQVIVWARYRAEIYDITKALQLEGIPAGVYFGDTSHLDRITNINDFQSGALKVFVANAQSAGTGLTLTAASVVIYYSNSFSLHDRLQSEDRAHRIGQKDNKVLYINLLARDTVDEHIQNCLSNKLDVANTVTAFKSLLKV